VLADQRLFQGQVLCELSGGDYSAPHKVFLHSRTWNTAYDWQRRLPQITTITHHRVSLVWHVVSLSGSTACRHLLHVPVALDNAMFLPQLLSSSSRDVYAVQLL
jgi:hypothetical protein